MSTARAVPQVQDRLKTCKTPVFIEGFTDHRFRRSNQRGENRQDSWDAREFGVAEKSAKGLNRKGRKERKGIESQRPQGAQRLDLI